MNKIFLAVGLMLLLSGPVMCVMAALPKAEKVKPKDFSPVEKWEPAKPGEKPMYFVTIQNEKGQFVEMACAPIPYYKPKQGYK